MLKVVDFIPSGSKIFFCIARSYAVPRSKLGYTRCAPIYPAAAAIRLLYWKTSPNLLVGCIVPSKPKEDSGVAFLNSKIHSRSCRGRPVQAQIKFLTRTFFVV